MLYFGYGSNLDIKRIKERCPSAQVIGSGQLENYKLVFQENNSGRIVANIVVDMDSKCWGTLFHIESQDVKALDRAEGHPNVYKRTKIKINFKGEELIVQTYIMSQELSLYEEIPVKEGFYTTAYKKVARGYGLPSQDYLNHIIKGYKHFVFDLNDLDKALEYSKEMSKKFPTHKPKVKPKKTSKLPIVEDNINTGEHLVFVYGTLKKTQPNHRLLSDSEYVGKATINGTIYDLPYGYPAVKQGDNKVIGEVYKVNDDTLKRLDMLEGYDSRTNTGMYLRRKTFAKTKNRTLEVYYYEWNRALPSGSILLEDGEEWFVGMFN